MSKIRLGVAVAALACFSINDLVQSWVMAMPSGIKLVAGFADVRRTWNRGVSFSLLWQGSDLGRHLLSLGLLIILVLVAFMALRTRTMLSALGYGLIIGGALGNLFDRWRYGAVFDFLSLHLGSIPLFVCNFADIGISLGVILLLLDGLVLKQQSA